MDIKNTNNKKIAKNTIYLYTRTFISIIITLYTSRIFLEQLGVEDFGIYNLVGSIVTMISVLNSLMASATQRFLSIEIGKNDTTQMNKIFNISILINLVIFVLFIVIGGILGLIFLNNFVVIPNGKIRLANIVFLLSLFSAGLNIIRSPYHALIIAKERLSFFAYISIIEVFAKLTITVLLIFFINKLFIFAIFHLSLSFIILYIYYQYCKTKIGLPIFKYYSMHKNHEYKALLSFSIWSLIGNSASVGRDQAFNFILNNFHGVVLNAAMGIVVQISNVYSSLFLNLQTAFKPQVIQNSEINPLRFQNLINKCAFYSLALMGLVCIPMVYGCKVILDLWLTTIPNYSVQLVQLIMIKILFASISQCIFMTLESFARIKFPQIIMTILSIISIISAYFLIRSGLEPFKIILIIIIMEILLFIYRLWYSSYKHCINAKSFIKQIYKIFIGVFILCIMAFYIESSICSVKDFVIVSIIFVFIYSIIILLSIDKNERLFIYSKILNKT